MPPIRSAWWRLRPEQDWRRPRWARRRRVRRGAGLEDSRRWTLCPGPAAGRVAAALPIRAPDRPPGRPGAAFCAERERSADPKREAPRTVTRGRRPARARPPPRTSRRTRPKMRSIISPCGGSSGRAPWGGRQTASITKERLRKSTLQCPAPPGPSEMRILPHGHRPARLRCIDYGCLGREWVQVIADLAGLLPCRPCRRVCRDFEPPVRTASPRSGPRSVNAVGGDMRYRPLAQLRWN